MNSIVQQVNWKLVVTAGLVVAVGAAASYGFLDGDTRDMVISFLIGGAAGSAIPTSLTKPGVSA